MTEELNIPSLHHNNNNIQVSKIKHCHTMKSTDPAIVARATTYSGKVACIVQVVSEEALAEYAEH